MITALLEITSLEKRFNMRRIFIWLFFSVTMLTHAYVAHSAEDPFLHEMVRITGGTFIMGSPVTETGRSPNEGPQREVTVSSFYIGRFPVTQEKFESIMGTNPSMFRGLNMPVERVNWFDAVEFTNRLSVASGLQPAYTINGQNVTWNRDANGYRLPTEAEWEFAARAGTQTPFSGGNTIGNTGWHFGNSAARAHPVGQRPPNPWGLYDMHGNVVEWCWDWLGPYPSTAEVNPIGPATGTHRVYRGGSWRFAAHQARSAFRFGNHPHLRLDFIGFRLVRNAEY
jgi:formylglycine-generating enzyme required for sulfatase activity